MEHSNETVLGSHPLAVNDTVARTDWMRQTFHIQSAPGLPVAARISADRHAIRRQVHNPELRNSRPGIQFPLGPKIGLPTCVGHLGPADLVDALHATHIGRLGTADTTRLPVLSWNR
jgi:hypothetical protein